MQPNGTSFDPDLLEVIANVERALSYCHAGIGSCFTRRTMDPLWLSLSLLVDGMPCLSPDTVKMTLDGNKISLKIDFDKWPCDSNSIIPLSAAKAGLIYHFNTSHSISLSLEHGLKFIKISAKTQLSTNA